MWCPSSGTQGLYGVKTCLHHREHALSLLSFDEVLAFAFSSVFRRIASCRPIRLYFCFNALPFSASYVLSVHVTCSLSRDRKLGSVVCWVA